MSVIYLNGAYLPAEEAKISVFDRSYLFGEGLFETFRSYEGKIPFLKDHLERLNWSATFLSIEYPAEIDFEKICRELLVKNKLENAKFKIVLSQYATGQVFPSLSTRPSVNTFVFCEPIDETKIPPTYRLKVIRDFVNDANPLVAVKTTNRLVKLMAHKEAVEAGYNDGILLNAKGMVSETCSANIFWVDKDAKLWSVEQGQGCLAGTMKKTLSALFKQHNINWREGAVTPQELSSAREVFVTNSSLGIKPVVAIDNRQISGGETGPITQMLMDLWGKFLKELVDRSQELENSR